MTSESRRTTSSRADARRRARLAKQGIETDDNVEEQPPAEAATPSGGMLGRIFPPARPLPGKPDPLIGFTYDGPLRPVVRTLWLLGRSPLVWIGLGVLWAVSYIVSTFYQDSIVAVVTSLGTFGSLVAAGWFGWQRPWAYGAAAAVVGQLGYAAVLGGLALTGTDIDGPRAQLPLVQVAVSLFVTGIFMVAIGALAGFYGGYLRRRMAEPRPASPRGRRR